MSNKMFMILSNGQPTINQFQAFKQSTNKTANAAKAQRPSGLHAPMISRIHNIQPGCGSCGRH
jgi:hypothetical protein